jgi:hypothetical protein
MTASRFDCLMSRSLTVSTATLLSLLMLLVAGVVGLFLWAGRRAGWSPPLVWTGGLTLAVTILLAVGVALFPWLLAPRAILITDRAVVVERRLRPIEIPLPEITAVRVLVPGDLDGGIRTGGSAGVFAQIGRFRSVALGDFRMYLRDEADGVVLDAGERFVLSPHPAVAFVIELHDRRRRFQA